MKRKYLTVIVSMLLIAMFAFSGCTKEVNDDTAPSHTYESSNVETNLILTSLSDTGVSVSMPQNVTSDKQVGVFYFIWQGTEGNYPHIYDNNEILSNFDRGFKSIYKLADWMEAGGGGTGTFHWWGQPLFGYYDMDDEWVITRHMQMLADADVDYIIIDQTNGIIDGYLQRIKLVCEVLYKLQQQGVDVPKLAFMAYDDTAITVRKLYTQIYKRYPEWNSIFYHWNNGDKPVIFDNIESFSRDASYMLNKEEQLAAYTEDVLNALEIRDVAFPHETRNSNSNIFDGKAITYLDFRENPLPFVDSDTGYSFMSVSVAEICGTNCSSKQWFGDTADRTRSWNGEKNLNWEEPDAYLYGYNIARQYQNALEQNPDNVFITGWNEWIAQNQARNEFSGVAFIDNADINNSRDIEPMAGGYGDNYYLQMCEFIRNFKYGSVDETKSASKTIDIDGDMSQWEDKGILSYTDAVGETFARDSHAANVPSLVYKTQAADNDIKTLKITSDNDNFYFYVETTDDIDTSDFGGITLVIKNSDFGETFVVNADGKMSIVKYSGDSEIASGTASAKIAGNKIMISVSRLIISDSTINFKWVECDDSSDEMNWYTCPEAAPYGRMFVKYCA